MVTVLAIPAFFFGAGTPALVGVCPVVGFVDFPGGGLTIPGFGDFGGCEALDAAFESELIALGDVLELELPERIDSCDSAVCAFKECKSLLLSSIGSSIARINWSTSHENRVFSDFGQKCRIFVGL